MFVWTQFTIMSIAHSTDNSNIYFMWPILILIANKTENESTYLLFVILVMTPVTVAQQKSLWLFRSVIFMKSGVFSEVYIKCGQSNFTLISNHKFVDHLPGSCCSSIWKRPFFEKKKDITLLEDFLGFICVLFWRYSWNFR